MTSRYYFAARYSRNAELRGYRDELAAHIPGAVVTSRWIDQHGGALEESLTPAQLNADPAGGAPFAEADLDDLHDADVVVSFTGFSGGKGGRHVEYGAALALGKRLVIVGPRENVFHCVPAVEQYRSWSDFLDREVG